MRDHRVRREARPSKDILIAGLERLEFRGYDSAGIALPEDDGLEYVRAVGNLANLKQAAGRERLAGDDGARPHALGDARRRHRGQRPSAHRLRRRQARDRPQRDRRELPRAEGASSRPPATRSAPRPTPRSSRTCSRPSTRATSLAAVCAVYARLEGHFTFVVIHHDEPGPARRRALRDAARDRPRQGRELPRLEPRARSSPRRAGSQYPGNGEVVEVTPGRGPRDRRRGRQPGRARRGRDRLGRRGRRARGLRDLHGEGDLRAARGLPGDDRRPRPPRRSSSWRASA